MSTDIDRAGLRRRRAEVDHDRTSRHHEKKPSVPHRLEDKKQAKKKSGGVSPAASDARVTWLVLLNGEVVDARAAGAGRLRTDEVERHTLMGTIAVVRWEGYGPAELGSRPASWRDRFQR